VARFLLEYFRGDVDRGFLFGGLFSTSQFIAALVFIASAALFIIRRKAGNSVRTGHGLSGGTGLAL
jgi:prolipoprotein diacylglyceryltransferase